MLRQDAQDFRQKVFQELTNLANRADSSPKSLETAIVQRLNSHSAEMNGLKRDLQLAQSQYTDGMFAKLEAIVCCRYHLASDGIALSIIRTRALKVFKLVSSASQALCSRSAKRTAAQRISWHQTMHKEVILADSGMIEKE